MDQLQIDKLWDVAFDARVWAESAIDMQKAGFPHGYKQGKVEAKLKAANEALSILDSITPVEENN